MVHSTSQRLELSLTMLGSTVSLIVTGSASRRTATLSPSGPSAPSEHNARIDERFEGSSTRDGEVHMLTLTRVGSSGLSPHTFTWRCTPAGDVTAHPGALRCVSPDPLDALPWRNGHFTQVPIVLADDRPTNLIVWDGEDSPLINLL
jgi:hypothetical protein